MPGETRTPRAWPIVVLVLLALCGLVPATVSADSATTLRARASQLSALNADLAGRSRSALLDLYSLDSRLARERAHLVALRIRTADVRAQRAAAELQLRVARHAFSATQTALAGRLQQLYEQGDADPVAIVLGASSVDDALSNLDAIDRIAAQDRAIVEQTRQAKHRLAAVTRALAARERELQTLADQAAQSTLALEQARAQRVSYLARLSGQRRLNAATIASLQEQAQAVEARAQELAAVSSSQPSGADYRAGGRMTVVATGYALRGRTATGAPAGWGVVAVDPSVIPLGTRMSIPGYGDGVAADTGGGIRGASIDLWFPTAADAAAWGRRTVTIALH